MPSSVFTAGLTFQSTLALLADMWRQAVTSTKAHSLLKAATTNLEDRFC